MDPGMQAARDAQRASEQSIQRMNQQAADAAVRRSMQEAEAVGRRAAEAGRRSSEAWARQQERQKAYPSTLKDHGFVVSLLLLPFRLLGFVGKLAILALAIVIIVGAAYVILGGRVPF